MENIAKKINGLDLIIESVKHLEYVEKVYLFGSRARGNNQERSDIDIAIVCPNATAAEWNYILETIDNVPTLIKIDCIRFDDLKKTNPLQQAIEKDKVVLYKRKNQPCT